MNVPQSPDDSDSRQRFPIVGIGASAGGFDALRRFLSAMPDNPGVAIVVIQHLAPDRPSLAPELLAKYTSMPIRAVEDSPVVKVGHVYVIPPGKYLRISGGKLSLDNMPAARRTPVAIDHFFRALALDQRQRCVGIILSGSGSDGTLGVKAIKASGGLVLAQTVESAEHDSMPESAIRSGAVDQVLAPEEMPEALVQFARHDYILSDVSDEALEKSLTKSPQDSPAGGGGRDQPPGPDDPAAADAAAADATTDTAATAVDDPNADDPDELPVSGLAAIVKLLRTELGRDFRDYRVATMARRTRRRMCLQQIDDFDNYLQFLRQRPGELDLLAKDLLISVTDFFRDREVWQRLADGIIPQIIDAKTGDEVVRIWVAGCATGEEAYTAAILVLEEISRQRKSCVLQVFASDIDKDALEIARAGRYPVSIEADITPERIKRFFVLRDGDLHYQVNKTLRETVVFADQNLISDPPFSQLDLICCRNVLIYLKPNVQQRIIGLFHFSLRQRGILLLGTAETVGRQDDLFETVGKRERIYRGIGPSRYDRLELPSGLGARRQKYGTIALSGGDTRPALLAQRKLLDLISTRAIMIDQQWRIVYISGDVNPYLSHPPGVPTDDLLKKIDGELRSKLRAAVHHVFSERKSVAVGCRVRTPDGETQLRLDVCLVPSSDRKSDFALIIFEQLDDSAEPAGGSGASESTESRGRPESRAADDQVADDQVADELADDEIDEKSVIGQLELELSRTKDDLQSTIEQFESSNEEFRASNEEVMSINEELQSTNEELETSKEELQSLNEELSTVNQQLASKVDELEIKHADLENLISATEVATLCLGTDLTIRWFTPATQNLIRVKGTDRGRSINDLQHDFLENDLVDDCEMVLRRLIPIESEVPCSGQRTYLRRVVPYRADDHRIGGVVITMVDITARKRREQDLQTSESQLRDLNRNLNALVARRTKLLNLLQHVTRVANESQSSHQALAAAMAVLTNHGDWIVGHVWEVIEDDEAAPVRVKSTRVWQVRENIGDRIAGLQTLQRLSNHSIIQQGRGFVGEVLQSETAVFLGDVRKPSGDPQIAPADTANASADTANASADTANASADSRIAADLLGLRSGLAFPITINGEVVAVMELFSGSAIQPDPEFEKILPDIGIQLGHVLQRQRTEQLVASIASAEQRRIGRELHDGIAQQLTGGALIAESLRRSLPPEMTMQLSSTKHLAEILQQAHEDVRRLSSGLMPENIDASDLIPSLRKLVAEARARFNIDVELRDEQLDDAFIERDDVATAVFHIAREALHNAIKHSQCKHMEMETVSGTEFVLEVHDGGLGFDLDSVDSSTNGLRIMRYRAESVGGTLKIFSKPKDDDSPESSSPENSSASGQSREGTAITLTIPAARCRK